MGRQGRGATGQSGLGDAGNAKEIKTMLYRRDSRAPLVDPSAWVAQDATVHRDVAIGKGAAVRTDAVVPIRTRLDPWATVPLGWVAVDDPSVFLASPSRGWTDHAGYDAPDHGAPHDRLPGHRDETAKAP